MAEYLTPEEVAGYLRIKRVRTVYEMIADGEFPKTLVIKRQYRIPKSDVEEFETRSKIKDVPLPILQPKRRIISGGVQ